ncbi:hypothetical protein TD95_005414 [Thielaviopsis punctulata]|uniref:RNA polymerase II holoenzyme cyclin-like subunit n=1 Tax=Thielaviopsis punctulata TaxID=72032 RepID=A0A0F4ZIY3_9PEZI|nr:hypothetical protein TD95_005414 [Thielaviopsis punctulata]
MSANYWESTHRLNWHFSKDQLATMRRKLEDQNPDLVKTYPLQQQRHLYMFFNYLINNLTKRLSIRQQAIATAQVYMKRYYTRVEIRRTNPYLVAAAALYLAGKIEESPQHIRVIVAEAKSTWPDCLVIDTSRLGECEFALIAEMNSQLIVHHPYRTLHALHADLALTQEDISLAWSLINDSYMTDLPLIADPHIIALTAIMLALIMRPSGPPAHAAPGAPPVVNLASISSAQAALIQATQPAQAHAHAHAHAHAQAQAQAQAQAPPPADVQSKKNMRFSRVQHYITWLAESNVDIEAMVDCTQEMVHLYEVHEQYNYRLTKEQVTRFIKAGGLDR